MVVQLSSLRVVSDLDASGFARGADQIKRSEQDMVAGARMVNVAMTDMEGKITAAGDPIAKLSRQFVTGYGETRRMEAGLRSINRSLEAGKIDASQASAIYAGMVDKLRMVANATDITAQGYAHLGQIVDQVNGKLARQPVVGGIAGTVANDNQTSFRRRNLTYQAVDVAQMAALGQAPTMLALQQGPQILQLYAGPGGVTAALADARAVAMGLSRVLPAVGVAALGVGQAFGFISEQVRSATGEAATMGEVMKATFGLIMDAIRPITSKIGGVISWVTNNLGSAAVDIAELVLNSFKGFGYDLAWAWDNAGTVIKAALYGVANFGIRLFNDMTEKIVANVNTMIDGINDRFGTAYKGFASNSLSITPYANPYADAASQAIEMWKRGIDQISKEQPIRDIGRAIAGQVESDRAAAEVEKLTSASFSDAIGGANNFATALGGVGTAASKARGEVGGMSQGLSNLGNLAQMQDLRNGLDEAQKSLAKWQNTASHVGDNIVTGSAEVRAALEQSRAQIISMIDQVANGSRSWQTMDASIRVAKVGLREFGIEGKVVDDFVDKVVKAALKVEGLEGNVHSLTAAINGIPDRVVNITISETRTSSGGVAGNSITQSMYPNGQSVYRSNAGGDYGSLSGEGNAFKTIGTIQYPGQDAQPLYEAGGSVGPGYLFGIVDSKIGAFASGGMIPPSGGGSSDTRFIQMMTRPDETISIHTPQQRQAVVDAMDRAGGQDGGTSLSFGDININLPAGADMRQGQIAGRAAADEFVSRVRSAMGARLHG